MVSLFWPQAVWVSMPLVSHELMPLHCSPSTWSMEHGWARALWYGLVWLTDDANGSPLQTSQAKPSLPAIRASFSLGQSLSLSSGS